MSDPTPNPDPKPTPTPEPDPKPEKVEFTPDQNDWISKKIAYEVKADREKREAADTEAKKKADEQRERDEATKRGEFDTVKQKLEGDLQTANTNLDNATAELTTLREYVNADIKAAIKDLPKALLAFDPGEDASLANRLDWLTKAKANAAEIAKETARPGNGPNPNPANGQFDLEAEKQRARQSGRYRV